MTIYQDLKQPPKSNYQRTTTRRRTAAEGRVIQSGVIRRGDGRAVVVDRNDLRYSIPEMLAIERLVIEKALSRKDEGAGLARPEAIAAVLAERDTLSLEQKEMLARLATSYHGVDVVYGPAGTGKTTTFAALREVFERSDRKVFGCAPGARAAQELEAKTGIESYTIDSLLLDARHPRNGGFLRGSVLVVDEAGMADTRKLRKLLWIAKDSGTKVVLAGDDRQLPTRARARPGGGGRAALLSGLSLADGRKSPRSSPSVLLLDS